MKKKVIFCIGVYFFSLFRLIAGGYLITVCGVRNFNPNNLYQDFLKSNAFYINDINKLKLSQKVYSNCAGGYRIDEVLLRSEAIPVAIDFKDNRILAGCCLKGDGKYYLLYDSTTNNLYSAIQGEFRYSSELRLTPFFDRPLLISFRDYTYIVTLSKVNADACVCKNIPTVEVYTDHYSKDQFKDEVMMIRKIDKIEKSPKAEIKLKAYFKRILSKTEWN